MLAVLVLVLWISVAAVIRPESRDIASMPQHADGSVAAPGVAVVLPVIAKADVLVVPVNLFELVVVQVELLLSSQLLLVKATLCGRMDLEGPRRKVIVVRIRLEEAPCSLILLIPAASHDQSGPQHGVRIQSVPLDPTYKQRAHSVLGRQNLADRRPSVHRLMMNEVDILRLRTLEAVLAPTLPVDEHVNGRRIQLGLADLALADALRSACVLDIEAREDSRLLLSTLLILAKLSLVAASDLSNRLSTKVFHVDLVS